IAGDGLRVLRIRAQANLALQSLRRSDLAEQHAVWLVAQSLFGGRLLGPRLWLGRARRRSGGSFGGGLGLLLGGDALRLLTLETLLAGLALVGVRARVTLADACHVEEPEYAVGGLRADAEPMLQPVLDEFHAFGGVLGLERIVGADLLDIAAVARAPRVGDDDTVVGPLLGAGPRQPDLQ